MRQAAAYEREQVASQLEHAQREVAVKQALCDGWQRANQVRHRAHNGQRLQYGLMLCHALMPRFLTQ
jgi:hypothetical protein